MQLKRLNKDTSTDCVADSREDFIISILAEESTLGARAIPGRGKGYTTNTIWLTVTKNGKVIHRCSFDWEKVCKPASLDKGLQKPNSLKWSSVARYGMAQYGLKYYKILFLKEVQYRLRDSSRSDARVNSMCIILSFDELEKLWLRKWKL